MWGGAGVRRAAGRVVVIGCRLLAWGRSCRVCSLVSWSVYPFHCISFRGRFSILGSAISGRSRHIIHLIISSGHHLIHSFAPFFSPSFDTGGGAFSCLPFRGLCGSVILTVYRVAAASRHLSPSRCLLSSGRFALPVLSSSAPCIVLASPSVVCRGLISSSPRSSPRSLDTAGGERSVPVLACLCGDVILVVEECLDCPLTECAFAPRGYLPL